MDQETIVAGMLHDILEDTATTMDELSEQFGQKIASIVNGVTKLTKFEGISIAENQIANFVYMKEPDGRFLLEYHVGKEPLMEMYEHKTNVII